MSMQEPTDDQLDGLFRKSAEEFNAPFDPVAWQAVKNRLDTHDRLTIWEHLLRWGIPVLLLLILIGGSWNAYQQRAVASQSPGTGVATRQPISPTGNPVPDRSTQHRQQRIGNDQLPVKETAVDPLNPDGLPETAIARSDKLKPSVLTGDANAMVANMDEDADKTNLSPTIRERNVSATTGVTDGRDLSDKATTRIRSTYRVKPARSSSTTNRGLTVKRPERVRVGTGQQKRSRQLPGGVTKNRIAATFSEMGNAIKPAQPFINQQVRPDATAGRLAKNSLLGTDLLSEADARSAHRFSGETSDKASFAELTSRPGQWPKPLLFADREVTAPINSVEAKQSVSTQPTPSQKGLSVRFVVSPDLSAIGLRNFQRPGTNIGLLLEYRLASRWSVQAGVMRSTKVYKALTSQYELPTYTAKWNVLPVSVNGRCGMLDIPINLRYDVSLHPRLNGQVPSRWFVSGGVTTYIMQQEDYIYNYTDEDRPHVYRDDRKEWHGSTGRYDFSQLNVSAGYERALSRRLSWQVEPFVKVPLKGVGYFKINLLSTGAFFSLRYKL